MINDEKKGEDMHTVDTLPIMVISVISLCVFGYLIVEFYLARKA